MLRLWLGRSERGVPGRRHPLPQPLADGGELCAEMAADETYSHGRPRLPLGGTRAGDEAKWER
jgi:hypothetical protein